MEVIDILTIIGYTITVFSLGYASEKIYQKNSSNRHASVNAVAATM